MSQCQCNIDDAIEAARNKNQSKQIDIQLLYLDLDVCEPCQATESNLELALDEVSQLLEKSGHHIKLEKIHIDSEQSAIQNRFLSSPTIRVNGQDIQLDYREDHCSTCSSLTNESSIDCRTWVYQGQEYHAPPREMIIESVLRSVYSDTGHASDEENSYLLPENLKNFFANKKEISSSCCAAGTSC